MGNFRISADSSVERFNNHHRFEHWYRDNTMYFITARCAGGFPAFAQEEAKLIFWNRFDHYTREFGFTSDITTLLDNHYHTLGYLKTGENLGKMMQRLHGSVAKLVNDLLNERRLPFWRDAGHHDYFDGCLRDSKQYRCAYRYTLMQSVRARLCRDPGTYAHTRVATSMEVGLKRALSRGALMEGVRYPRYE